MGVGGGGAHPAVSYEFDSEETSFCIGENGAQGQGGVGNNSSQSIGYRYSSVSKLV